VKLSRIVRTGALVLAGILAACARTSAPQNPPGGAFVVVQQREPMSLNPDLENGMSSTEWGLLLFQYLVKFDDRGRLVGDAAEAVPSLGNGGISRDGRTITYHLKHGVRFSDGTPLTAADCVASIDAVNDPSHNVQSRYGFDVVARAEAPDPRTLVLHLRHPFAPLLTLVLAPQGFPILPAHVLRTLGDFNKIDLIPVGSGPYVAVRWIRGDRVELRANPYYYRGKPKIENLTIRFITDPNTAMNLLRTGEAGGYFNDLDLGDVPLLRAIPRVRTTTTPVNAVGAIIFNTNDPVTRDARVRHALAEAIDMPALIAKTYRGAVSAEQAGRGLYIWAFDPQASPDVPYDPARARALLEQAGWKLGPDGVRRNGGRRLEVLFVIQAATPGDATIANGVTQYEKAIGADVTVKQFTATQIVAPANAGGPVYGGKFQLALYPFVNGDDPDTTDQFACANVPPRGYNKSRICDPRLDALLARARSTYDPVRRRALYAQLQQLLSDELPIELIYQRREIDAFSDRLRNQTTSVSSAFWNVGAWELAS
jgi:peptide/nickel transport system substrate-binding protein